MALTAQPLLPNTSSTQQRLLEAARHLFWTRGYSNVPLRDIARAAGVDVALIRRYFGNKEGLFTQTLPQAFDVLPEPETLQKLGRDGLIDFVIDVFASETVDQQAAPSVVDMIAINGQDPDVGARVVAMQRRHIHSPLVAVLGSDARAELFWAVIIGCCVTQNSQSGQSFSTQNAAMLRHMLQSAASFGPPAP